MSPPLTQSVPFRNGRGFREQRIMIPLATPANPEENDAFENIAVSGAARSPQNWVSDDELLQLAESLRKQFSTTDLQRLTAMLEAATCGQC